MSTPGPRPSRRTALWIEAGRDVTDRINAAVRDLQEAEDNLTRLPTWEHLARSAKRVQAAAERLVAVVAEGEHDPITGPMPWPEDGCDHLRMTCEDIGCPNADTSVIPPASTEEADQ